MESDLTWTRSTFSADLKGNFFERDPEVGRISDKNCIGSAIFRVGARRIRTDVKRTQ